MLVLIGCILASRWDDDMYFEHTHAWNKMKYETREMEKKDLF